MSTYQPQLIAEIDEAELSSILVNELTGMSGGTPSVVWTAQGSDVVLHVDSIAVRLTPGHLEVDVDCETDETGRVAQRVCVALALPAESPNFAATAGSPRTADRVATRWGPALQDAVWGTVVRLAGDDALGVAADRGRLIVHRSDPSGPSRPPQR
jgi:hypothetical protein